MEKKNRELARENTELKKKITSMKRIEGDLLKDKIKKEYFGFRVWKRISGELEKNINMVENVLSSLKNLKMDIPKNGPEEVLGDKSNQKE
ncbi:uncharacterized protein Eint_071625 [Encephalitozoon intestinalis ATCC 50506]|uniref:Uncharacterized protein n=1 Tax=Encephalitozoon intestinalis (strain ATCC 50506) TaxID=876142 RepID=W8P921_ENCIT|nr:uncharacterized protein Eint_071625 [Encephalitozoon intestinalis ATCC 50506]AHL30133.1 hypothetical protein Eint_071625 [Encephalitozoon intestinalis ATCC 50506]UTX45679.1 hypothetical protein GPK93_07g12480 [Encephalitozoon intestinalis]